MTWAIITIVGAAGLALIFYLIITGDDF